MVSEQSVKKVDVKYVKIVASDLGHFWVGDFGEKIIVTKFFDIFQKMWVYGDKSKNRDFSKVFWPNQKWTFLKCPKTISRKYF
jgi:hypothetical protein